jgi:hypothetical protein
MDIGFEHEEIKRYPSVALGGLIDRLNKRRIIFVGFGTVDPLRHSPPDAGFNSSTPMLPLSR